MKKEKIFRTLEFTRERSIGEIRILRMYPEKRATKYTRVRGADTPSVRDFFYMSNSMEIENIRYDTALRKKYHVMFEYDYPVYG